MINSSNAPLYKIFCNASKIQAYTFLLWFSNLSLSVFQINIIWYSAKILRFTVSKCSYKFTMFSGFFSGVFLQMSPSSTKTYSQAFHHLYLVRLNKVGWLSVWYGGRLIERLQTKDRIADFNIYSFYLKHCTFMFFLA